MYTYIYIYIIFVYFKPLRPCRRSGGDSGMHCKRDLSIYDFNRFCMIGCHLGKLWKLFSKKNWALDHT